MKKFGWKRLVLGATSLFAFQVGGCTILDQFMDLIPGLGG